MVIRLTFAHEAHTQIGKKAIQRSSVSLSKEGQKKKFVISRESNYNKNSMFTLLATATASEKNKIYPLNEKHSALVFVLAEGIKLAEERTVREMSDLGWKNIRIEKSKEVNSYSLDGKDKTLKDAFASAQRSGFGVVVYEDPIK